MLKCATLHSHTGNACHIHIKPGAAVPDNNLSDDFGTRMSRYHDKDTLWWRPEPKPSTRTESNQIIRWSDRNTGVSGWNPRLRTLDHTSTLRSFENGVFWDPERLEPGVHRDRLVSWKEYGNIGGSFSVVEKKTIAEQIALVNTILYRGQMAITGYQETQVPPLADPTLPTEALRARGTTAISRVLPNDPNAGLATFLGELREGLPSPPALATYRAQTQDLLKKQGGEYLNVVFGWQPMLKDLRKFAHSYKKSTKTLEQFLKGSGKKIRRRYHYPEEKHATVYSGIQVRTGSAVTGYTLMRGDVSDETTVNRWFSGAFRYHVPGGNSALDRMKAYESAVNHLLGTRITPEVLWNLTPWSWMLDWFGNTGDLMKNISLLGQDGMAMQYGYMMEHVETKRTITSSFSGQPLKTVIHYSSKRRVAASPYGFETTLSSLSSKQWAVLIALGISRGDRSQ